MMSIDSGELITIAVDLIIRCRYQPRRHFDDEALRELADSIKINGLLQPIVARDLPDGRFELIAGERRWRAFQIAGFDRIPAIVKRGVSDQDMAQLSIVENICRENLSLIEQAEGFQRLAYEFNLSHAEIAEACSTNRSHVSNAIRMLSLPDEILRLVNEKKLLGKHCEVLLSQSAQKLGLSSLLRIVNQCVRLEWSSRELERQVKASLVKTNEAELNHELDYLKSRLSDHFATSLDIRYKPKSRSGTLLIEFSSLEVLEGILNKSNFSIDSELEEGSADVE